MALILETGEGLHNAESLVSLAEVRAFASSRGKTVSAVDADLEAQVRMAHDYLLENEGRLQGWRRTEGQALSFPRSGVVLYNYSVAEGTIPVLVKNAICQLVIDSAELDAMPVVANETPVIEEAVGPIKTVYAQPGLVGSRPYFPRVEMFMAPLYNSSGGMSLVTIRV